MFLEPSEQLDTKVWACSMKDCTLHRPALQFFSMHAQDTESKWHLRIQPYTHLYHPSKKKGGRDRKGAINTIHYTWHSYYHYALKRSWGYLHWVYIKTAWSTVRHGVLPTEDQSTVHKIWEVNHCFQLCAYHWAREGSVDGSEPKVTQKVSVKLSRSQNKRKRILGKEI